MVEARRFNLVCVQMVKLFESLILQYSYDGHSANVSVSVKEIQSGQKLCFEIFAYDTRHLLG
jgi:hypothetical protein